MTQIIIPIPKTPLLDPRSGLPTREWYRFWALLVQAVGGSTDIIVNVDVLTPPGNEGSSIGVETEAMEAWSYGSQNAGLIEDLRKKFDGLDPQIPGPAEFAELVKAVAAALPFAQPPSEPQPFTPDVPFPQAPIELGSLEAAKNIGYRVVASGNAVLVAGTVTVNSIYSLSANEFALTAKVVGGTQGILSVGTITANTSFVINSSNAADTSTVSWVIFEPLKG